jgi:hypothetical protein
MAKKKKAPKKKTTPKKKVTPKKKKVAPKKKSTLKKKPVSKKKKPAPKKKAPPKPKEKPIGSITHYFPHVRAAVIKLKAPLSVGETIKIKGHTTDFTQNVISLQMDRAPIHSAKKGQEIGLQVDSRVRQHDLVYKA